MYCLRCGREIPDQQSFCDSCKEEVSKPLVESPYLNTQIRLPVRKPKGAKSPVKPGKKPERKPEKSGITPRQGGLIAFLSCLALVLAGAVLILTLFFLQGQQTLKEQKVVQATLEEEKDFLTHRVGELNVDYVLINPQADKIYHRLDCPEAQMDGFYLIRLVSAQLQGYTPCAYCE